MAIKSIFHINVNCRNLDRSRAFYENLGFEGVLDLPEGGKPEMLRGLGLPPSARGRAVIMMLDPKVPRSTRLDLIEWTEPPTGGEALPDLTHVGAARIALWTKGIEAEYQRLRAEGVEFLSEPVDMNGSWFCCFKDPDGTVLELIDFG